jgi:gas vesicle protein
MKREESRHDFAFMAGVVIGAVAGALATLALAPRAGTETRDRLRSRMEGMPVDDLRARARSLRDVAAEHTGQLREAASSASASDVVQSTRSRVTGLVDRSPLPVTLGEGQDHDEADEVADSLAAAADEAQSAAAQAGEELATEADTVIDEATASVSDAGAEETDEERKPEVP